MIKLAIEASDMTHLDFIYSDRIIPSDHHLRTQLTQVLIQVERE